MSQQILLRKSMFLSTADPPVVSHISLSMSFFYPYLKVHSAAKFSSGVVLCGSLENFLRMNTYIMKWATRHETTVVI